MKIISIIGARPQFIKAASVSKALRAAGHLEVLIHTGQHYDANMSEVFFTELGIPKPDLNLSIGSGLHGQQTGEMLAKLEAAFIEEKPDFVLIYGDTNSTLAGALAGAKLNLPIAHVEAGLRSFNRKMPEEINRVVADHLSSILFCPSQLAVDNLVAEGITTGVHLIGDVMYDAVQEFSILAKEQSKILKRLRLQPQSYLLATVHRAENTDDPIRLRSIWKAFSEIEEPVIFPLHPRTKKMMEALNLSNSAFLRLIEPLGYLDMLMLQQNARVILTDSGGVQKEAYWLGIPCITLREETEWAETVGQGWNILTGADQEKIKQALDYYTNSFSGLDQVPLYGDGQASARIISIINDCKT